MAKISTPAMSFKMYRHFAVITLAATLMMAIFSSGERRQAVAEQIAAQQAAAKTRRDATRAKYGTPHLIRADRDSAGSYSRFSDYSDTFRDFGTPMDFTGSRVQNVDGLDLASKKCAKGHRVQLTRTDEDTEGPALGKCIGEEPQAEGPADAAARQKEINALVAASLNNTQKQQAGNTGQPEEGGE
jgi:hypothetical protein